MEIITEDLEISQTPPTSKRWKNIWRHELEFAVKNKEEQDLFSPDYTEIKRQRKRKKVVVKSKRKTKKIKKQRKR